jgi:FAD:protein FMN transferase
VTLSAVRDAYRCTLAVMGTVVSVEVLGHGTSQRARRERKRAVDRAVAWFTHVESVCSRFEARSELRQLSVRIGDAVPVSALLFEAVHFAVAVAEATNGAFDPTVGTRLESRGYDREHRSGAVARSGIEAASDVSYRDVELDAEARTITLHRPLVLDLGAVAKGLAIDTAARELAAFADFAIDAGGDLYLGGHNAEGAPWAVGITHPRDVTHLFETVQVRDAALCTSGDYERPQHILDPRIDATADAIASVTVMAPLAMVADALATAAFVLGPTDGLALLEQHGLAGLMITPTLERRATRAWPTRVAA